MDFREDKNAIIVIMKNGEDLKENLLTLAQTFKNYPLMAIVTALGMLKDVKMGYWNGKEYEIHEEKEPCELLGISGIITPGIEPQFHLHLILGNREGVAKGGHFMEAKVCNTLEMILVKSEIKVERYEEGGLRKLRIANFEG